MNYNQGYSRNMQQNQNHVIIINKIIQIVSKTIHIINKYLDHNHCQMQVQML